MNRLLKILLPLSLTICGQYTFAQQQQDSTIKNLILNEVYIRAYTQSKYPGSSFYQSSNLSGTEEILSKIEGISLIRRGPIGMEPTLRSFSGGQINMVIDGMKFFGACTDKMDPATIYIEPVNLKSMDVRFAGEGLSMGSSVGGALNLKLAGAELSQERRLSGTLASGFYSAASAVQNILALNYGSEKWALRASGVYRKAGNYRNGANQQVPFSQYEKANVSISGKYQLSKSGTLRADLLFDEGWNIGYPALPMDVGNARANIAALTYTQDMHEGLLKNIEAKVYLNSIRHAMDDTKRPQVPIHMDMPGQSDTQGAFVQTQIEATAKHQFSVKLDAYHNRVKADMVMYPAKGLPMYMLTWPQNHQSVAGLFLQDQISLNDHSKLDLKMRLDAAFSKINGEMGIAQFSVLGYDVSKSRNAFLKNVSMGYTHYLGSQFTIYAGGGYSERLPSTSERYGFYLFNRMDNHDYMGNPDLKNENAYNAELNFILSGRNVSFKLSGFSNYLQNYILGETQLGMSSMTIGADGVRAYRNIPAAYISGAESQLNYQFANEHFTLNNSLKWVQGRDTHGMPLPLISPLKSVTSLRFVHHNLFIQIENELASAQKKVNISYGELASSGFSILNLRSTYTFALKNNKLEFAAGVENLLDKAYYEHLDWGKMLRPGRNVYTMLSLKF